ncbi:DUF3179 domain-containing protein [Marinobacter sp. SS8-8]|uniref:DUF3179 domain-containing protein n=1 Tax=Marinobacter sp. SS8-8 TaxID=3050452 RepID=UPI0026DFB193|nr:DUF3179 domain-containing protein [Marinobacter sp. SS8-8]|tara:strand:+ start:2916 stop:3851 length:936 start_codon:yes stop_codon:yes gene_type:complete
MDNMIGSVLIALLLWATQPAIAESKNGFDVSNARVPVDEILRGGPPRDGIPSIDDPKFERPANSLPWRTNDLMLTFDAENARFAYPIGILNWHEIVNHDLDGTPLLITFCPLCGTGMAFDPEVEGRHLTFGVSGLLYNSDLLMYDHQTESLWSQIEGRAISGPLAGTELRPVAIRHELWGGWQERVGLDGQVLSTDTGHSRNYRMSPYGNYHHSERLYFPVTHTSRKYHPKTWVLGWTYNGESKAWPFPELADYGAVLDDQIGGKAVRIHYDPEVPSAELRDASGKLLPATRAFWFAWYTFHPETRIYEAD